MIGPGARFRSLGRALFALGYVDVVSGNLSERRGDHVWITRSGARLDELGPEDVVLVPLGLSDARTRGASSEWIVHRRIYLETDASAIAHAHPREAVHWSLTHERLLPVDSEAEFLVGTVPVVAPEPPAGSPALAEAVATAVASGACAVLVRRHGVFAIGPDLRLAVARLCAVAHAAALAVGVGGAPSATLSDGDDLQTGGRQR